jgi:hypothetical protein
MALRRLYDRREDIPAGLESAYVERDGKWVLDVEGMVPKEKLDEFRNNNVDLQKRLDELSKKKHLDPEEYDELMELREEQQKNKDKQLIDAGKIDELVETRTERMRKDHETALNAAKSALDKKTKAYDTVYGQLRNLRIESEVSRAVNEVGVPVKGALNDIILRARDTWQLDDNGKLVPRNDEGQTIYSTNGKDVLSMGEWADDLYTRRRIDTTLSIGEFRQRPGITRVVASRSHNAALYLSHGVVGR